MAVRALKLGIPCSFAVWCVVLVGSYFLAKGFRSGHITPREFLSIAGIGCILIFLVAYPVMKLHSVGEFYYGAKSNFFNGTMWSLVCASAYDMPYPAIFLVAILYGVLSISFVGPLLLIALMMQRKDTRGVLTIGVSLLMLGTSGVIIIQAFVLGTPLPQYRTGLFIIPLFYLLVIFLLSDLSFIKTSWKPLLSKVLLVMGVMSAVHFCITGNMTHCLQFKHDADTKRMLADLDAWRKTEKKEGGKVRICSSWMLAPSITLYKKTLSLDWLEDDWIGRSGIRDPKDFDFFFCYPREPIDNMNKPVFRCYTLSGNVLRCGR